MKTKNQERTGQVGRAKLGTVRRGTHPPRPRKRPVVSDREIEKSRGGREMRPKQEDLRADEPSWMNCPKCASLMVPERFIDYKQTGDAVFQGWRCLICGLILDPLILVHRKQQEGRKIEYSEGPLAEIGHN